MSKRVAAAVRLAERVAGALSLPAFSRRSAEGPSLPGRLPPDEYDSLVDMVGLFLSVRGERARLWGGELVVRADDGLFRFDLAPLVEACCGMPRSGWPDAVAAFLGARLGGPVPDLEAATAPPGSLHAEVGPAARVAPPRPLAAMVMAAPERPWALASARLASLSAAAASVRTSVGQEAVFFWALLRQGAVVCWGLLCRLGAWLRARLPGVAAALTALWCQAGVLPSALLRRGTASWKARLHRAVPEPEPEPAPVGEEWSAFSALVVECLRRHGCTEARVGRSAVHARDWAGRTLRLQAPGLERMPRDLRREWWEGWVDEVLGERLRALRGREALSGRSFDDVRDLLALQLYDQEWLSDEVLGEAVFSRDLPGLISAVVCRLPEGTFRLSSETVTAWRVDVQAVAEAALTNLRRLRPAMQRVVIAPGVEGMRFQGGEFAAAQAVLLGDNTECAGPYGALVALPQRSLLLVCQLRPMAEAAAVYTGAAVSLITRVLRSEAEGHMPLSRRLYWYRKGAFMDLPYEVRVEGEQPVVEFEPTAGLAAALAQMGQAGGGVGIAFCAQV